MGTMLRGMKDLKRFTIGATDGDIGQVEAFYFDDASFTVRHLVVDTPAAGCPGVRVDLTREQIKNSPEYDPSGPVQREYETRLYDLSVAPFLEAPLGAASECAAARRQPGRQAHN